MKNFFLKIYKYYIFLILIHNSLHLSQSKYLTKYIDDFEFQNYQLSQSISKENLNELNYYSEILKNYFYSIAENISKITKNSIPENFKDTIINNVELSKEEISYFFKRNIAYNRSLKNNERFDQI